MSNPHDALFKRVFSQPEHAAGELKHVLPDEIVRRIDWDTLELSSGSFVDEGLREAFSDLVYSVHIEGRSALLYLLVEHKSWPDAHTALQLYLNIGRIWEDFRRKQPNDLLPPVIPIVVHHGRTDAGWTRGTELLDSIELTPELRRVLGPFLPNLRYLLDDLSSGHAEAIFARSLSDLARIALFCLERSRKCDDLLAELSRRMDAVQRLCADSGIEALKTVVWYALDVQDLPDENITRFLSDVGSKAKGDMTTTLERWAAKWEAENGFRVRSEAKSDSLMIILTQRFGAVPQELQERLRGVSLEQLDDWLMRSVSASTLREVFDAASGGQPG